MAGSDHRTQAELLRELREGSPRQQELALNRLAYVGEAEALDAVVDYMKGQPPAGTRAGLRALRILAMKYMPGSRYDLAEALLPYLESEDWSQRITAARLLNNYPNELATDPLWNAIVDAQERISDEPDNRRLSTKRALAERVLAETVMAYANCGKLVVLPDILAMLDEPYLKPLATRALGMIGSDTERDRLEDLAEDENIHVRDAAQWSLGWMDERAAQFEIPPNEIPEPPPDRISPLYWSHRQLFASDDPLEQFLVVRLMVEHVILDTLFTEGHVSEGWTLLLRRFEGEVPPDFRQNHALLDGAWAYAWNGPGLDSTEAPSPLPALVSPAPGRAGQPPSITLSYPTDLSFRGEGLISLDCLNEPGYGRGWIYHLRLVDGAWTFSRVRQTWAR
jgi:hypothetical protein